MCGQKVKIRIKKERKEEWLLSTENKLVVTSGTSGGVCFGGEEVGGASHWRTTDSRMYCTVHHREYRQCFVITLNGK